MTGKGSTYTVATLRQKVGVVLALIGTALTFAMAAAWSINLWQLNGPVQESEAQVYAWSYVLDQRGLVASVAYPPILLWIGLALANAAFGVGLLPANSALRGAYQADERRRGRAGRAGRRERWRAALRNYRHQIRERGHIGLLHGRVSLRLGVALAGAASIVGVSLLAASDLSTDSPPTGEQAGVLPWICLVGGGLAVIGVLLSFPYGHRQKVTVDAFGNVHDVGAATSWQPPAGPPATAVQLADTSERDEVRA